MMSKTSVVRLNILVILNSNVSIKTFDHLQSLKDTLITINKNKSNVFYK